MYNGLWMEFSVSLYSRFSFLPSLNASVEGNVKKTALENKMRMKRGFVKISLENHPWSEM